MTPSSCYLAGPMRGYPRFNFDAFDAAAADLRAQGWTVISPADIDREHGFDPDKHDESYFSDFRDLIRRDVEAVLTTDCIVLLPGWDRSVGVAAELAVAKWAGKPALLHPTLEAITNKPAPRKPLILGFGSIAQVGKDFAASVIGSRYSAKRVAFADALKADLAPLFEVNGFDYAECQTFKKDMIRPLLVSYGETMRKLRPDIWIDRAMSKVQGLLSANGVEVIVVSDVRYPNEVDRIKALGGYYVHIVSEKEPANDVERQLVPEMLAKADFTLRNNFDGKYSEDVLRLVDDLISKSRS